MVTPSNQQRSEIMGKKSRQHMTTQTKEQRVEQAIEQEKEQRKKRAKAFLNYLRYMHGLSPKQNKEG